MSKETAISTDVLTRRFGDIVAVNTLSFEVDHGEVFGFLGHNGAGKTTTVRLLNGVLAPSSGSARVLGMSSETQGPALRRQTGILTETPSLDERLTARENLTIYADLYGVPKGEVKQRIETLLETFNLADRAGEKVGAYSKGMKQRLALCRALIHRPNLLFLDEPTAGLDPVAARQVHDLIRHMSQEEGHTVFLCTHNLVEAQRLCHRVAVMDHGRMVAVGTPAELAQQIGIPVHFEIEVAPEHVEPALARLREMRAVATFEYNDAAIQVTGATRELIPELLAVLVGAGVRVYRVAPQEASLEDIYFALQDREVKA